MVALGGGGAVSYEPGTPVEHRVEGWGHRDRLLVLVLRGAAQVDVPNRSGWSKEAFEIETEGKGVMV